jgi:uncharacterized protein (DUF305 family)
MSKAAGLALAFVISLLMVVGCDNDGGGGTPTRSAGSHNGHQGSATATGEGHSGMPSHTTTAGGLQMEIKDDLTYIKMMVPHHQLAVDMALLAQKHAKRPELRGLANDIILTQADEISRMNMWREELGGGSPTTPEAHSMDEMMSMPGMDVDLDALAKSEQFDVEFANAMIPHHQSAIDMSRAALPHLKHAPLRDMAQDVIVTQQLEIDRMRGWLEAWK